MKEELLHFSAEELALREVLLNTGELFRGYHPALEKVHLKQARRLKEIIEKNDGFPTITQVGKDAAVAAVKVVLRAVSWPDFMRSLEEPLFDLAKKNEAPRVEVAMLIDSIRYHEGRQEVYGTCTDWDENGILRVPEVEDPVNLNSRRAHMGLPPLESLVITSEQGEFHPPHPAQRHQDFISWARKVGWRQ
jgi:hypothetical protein